MSTEINVEYMWTSGHQRLYLIHALFVKIIIFVDLYVITLLASDIILLIAQCR